MKRVLRVALAAVVVTACAVGLGGPSPVDEDALALRLASDATPAQIAQLLKERGVEVAILSGAFDSAWYADLAKQAGMQTTRPRRVGGTTFAFLGPKPIGDTTLVIKVKGGGEVHIHDALYGIDKHRRLDLMAVRIDASARLPEAVDTLLDYVASDVNSNASVYLAIEPPTPALGDSISMLLRALYSDTWECTEAGRTARTTDLPIRLFYGPVVRVKCNSAERLNMGNGGILARLTLTR